VKPRGVTDRKGIIAWFASNHVAANLLMYLIIVAGLLSASTIRKQMQPDFELNNVQVQVLYLGAAPQEVEEGVVIKVEEAIQDVDGIVKLMSSASEGVGTVTAEVSRDADLNEVLSEIKTRVDAISTFPALTEKPVISKQEIPFAVAYIAIYGDMDPVTRKSIAQNARDELMQLPAVNRVLFLGDRDFEISVEVSEHTLRQYGLTMSEISQAIKNSSADLPGGTIKSQGGDILLRTEGQVYTGIEFSELVLRTFGDGTRLTLGDIATIRDGFVESNEYSRFNGRPSAILQILTIGEQNELATAAAVREYVARKSAELPDGIQMDIWADRANYLQDRLDMMFENMLLGALLVFIVLSLFLRMKVAGWVIVGIPITFFGALWLMPVNPWPVTINMVSLFGFIVVLGIVVDDAIIIGESVYTKIRADGHTLDNVIDGAQRVAVPATFGVLTTMAAFAPMLFIGGIFGPFFEAISVVVMLCLLFSLVESKLILPAHLVHARIPDIDEDDLFNPQRKVGLFERVPRFFLKIQRHVQHGLQAVIHNYYRPLLSKAIDNRGVTIAIFIAVLIVTGGLVSSGLVRQVMVPEIDSDFIRVEMRMQTGTAPRVRDAAVDRIETDLLALSREFLDNNPDSVPMIKHIGVFTNGDTGATLVVEMPRDEDRPYEVVEISDIWRERVGEIPGIKSLTFEGAVHMGGGPPLSFRLNGSNYAALEAAAMELEQELATYAGVFEVQNSAVSGGDEIRLTIKPEAEALGLTLVSLGRQVRQAFYGEEAQRIQRGKDELKVMVRYPEDQRRSIADLENMRIRTPAGDEVPFSSVAEVNFGESYTSIQRQDRQRTVTVSANIDPERVEPQEVIRSIRENFIPDLLARHAGVSFDLEGASEEERNFIRNLSIASVAAFFLIYALIAVPLHSYGQPLIIMSVIPFGFIGAVLGHIIMGKAISMFSMFGLIALAGVVVNDSLIMVDFINRARQRGADLRTAVIESGTQRFRAIVLTSFTTAAGLLPIMTETSMQAQFVIPMAISLGFGILFATVITLFLVPSLYLLQIDAMARVRYLWDLLLGRPERSESSV
jgi:multidrug efflux pump subunit AcrB